MLLQLNNISKGYGETGTHSFRPVLNELHLEINQGDKISIIGKSGSGKTTLLNLIGALDVPDSGEIIFAEKNITNYSKKELANFRNQHLGFIFQLHHLMPQLTLWENVLLPLLPQGKISKEQKRLGRILNQKSRHLGAAQAKTFGNVGGECQRTAVVRALINKPELILADEPTGALDEENAFALSELLIQLSDEENVTLVTVTHSTELAEKMDKKFTLQGGKLAYFHSEK